jgi:basic membrane protein A
VGALFNPGRHGLPWARHQRRNTVRAALLILVFCALVVPGAAQSPAPLKPMKLAAVFSGPVNDAGWTAAAYRGLQDLKEHHGFKIAYTENVKPADADQIIRSYAKAGFDIILGHGFEWGEALQKAAKEFPQARFIQTNGSASNIPNLYTITFTAGEGGYFMGLVAAHLSKSGHVAYIAGTSFPILEHQIKMTRQAAKDLGKKLEVTESYVGNWSGDVAKAKELAQAALEHGVDVLILEADAADPGTVEAAKDAVKAGKYARVISWVRDKHELAPDLVVGGWEERVPVLIDFCVRKIQAGEKGGHFAIGLKEGAVAMNPFYGLVSPEVEKMVKDKLEAYMKDPHTIPSLVVRNDL